MLPVVLAPAAVQTPQAVDVSSYLAQASDAALGRLPVQIVPQPVQGARVENNQRGGQQGNERQAAPSAAANSGSGFAAGSFAGNQEIRLPSPFSTTFLAQLFGQAAAPGNQAAQANVQAIWMNAGADAAADTGFVDYERLEEYGQVKYAPSGAKLPLESAAPSLPAVTASALPVLTYRRSLREGDTSSVFNNGMAAYNSTQGRNLAIAVRGAQEYSGLF